jgi:hypothetical protein
LDKTWRPLVAGILQLISGIAGLIVVFGLVIAIFITGNFAISGLENVPIFAPALLVGITIPLAIGSILSLIGGIYTIQRKMWILAIIGSVSSIFSSIPLLGGLPVGITSTILVILSKQEFEDHVTTVAPSTRD